MQTRKFISVILPLKLEWEPAYALPDGITPEMVKVGDRVITSKYSGTEVKADGVEYTIVRQADILAIVE